MSKIALQGNGSGTGKITIASPNTNSDRVLTLPDTDGAILTSGGIIDTGATGQIKFPATPNPSTDVNTLDDYEEGIWTPIIQDANGGYATMSTGVGSQNTGFYVKIGSLVFLSATVQWTSISGLSSGRIMLSGFPFTCVGSLYFRAAFSFGSASPGSFTIPRDQIGFGIDYTKNFLWGTYVTGNNEDNPMVKSHLGSSGTLYGVSGCFMTSYG